MAPTSDVLRSPSPCDHHIQAYTDDAFLGKVVAEYVAAGFEQGEAAVLIATPEHTELFSERFAALGIDVPAALRTRQLLFLDADQTLARFMVDGRPDRQMFLSIVATTLDHVRAAGYRIAVFRSARRTLLAPPTSQGPSDLATRNPVPGAW